MHEVIVQNHDSSEDAHPLSAEEQETFQKVRCLVGCKTEFSKRIVPASRRQVFSKLKHLAIRTCPFVDLPETRHVHGPLMSSSDLPVRGSFTRGSIRQAIRKTVYVAIHMVVGRARVFCEHVGCVCVEPCVLDAESLGIYDCA
jgi:hypothetical protein